MSDTTAKRALSGTIKGAFISGIIGLIGVFITIVASLYIHKDAKEAAVATQKEAAVYSFSTIYDSVRKDMTYDEAIMAVVKEKTEADRKIASLTQTNISLTTEKESLVSMVDELTEKHETLSLAADEKRIALAVDNAKQYAQIGEHPKAIEILHGITNRNFEADKLLWECSANYEAVVIAHADELRKAKQYNEALAYIQDSLKIIPDSTVLKEKKNDMENGFPKKLTEITCTTNRYYSVVSPDVDFPTDVLGNQYTSGNTVKMYAASAGDYGFAVYNLDEKYNYISGTLSVSSETDDPDHTTLEGRIEIYLKKGNEYIMLYKSDHISRITDRIETPEIALNKAEWIEIRFYNKQDYVYNYNSHSLVMILSDFILYS